MPASRGGGGGPSPKARVRRKPKRLFTKREYRVAQAQPKARVRVSNRDLPKGAVPREVASQTAAQGRRLERQFKPKTPAAKFFEKPKPKVRSREELLREYASAKRRGLLVKASGPGLSEEQVRKLPSGAKVTVAPLRFQGSSPAADLAAPALRLLEESTRPVHAIAGGTKAAIEHKNVARAALRGLRNQDKVLFSDVLKSAGVESGTASALLGTALDIGLDPTTYASLGGAVPKKVLEAKALQAAGRGDVKAATRLRARAAKAPSNKGVQVRARAHVPFTSRGVSVGTSGVASARALRAVGASRAATGVRESRYAQAAGKALDPNFRPRDATVAQHAEYVAARRRKRALESETVRHAERRGQAYKKALPDEKAQARVIAALEGHLGPLTKEEQEVAHVLRGELDMQLLAERAGGRAPMRRPDYFPHVLNADVQKQVRTRARGRAARNPHAEARQYEGSISEIHAERAKGGDAPLFTENIPAAVTTRLAKGGKSVADRRYLKDLSRRVAKPLTQKTFVGRADDQVIYRIDHQGKSPTLHKVDDEEARAYLGGTRKGQGDYVVLPKSYGDAEVAARNRGEMGPIRGAWNRAIGGWKTWVTVANVPAYDLRNLYGDSFNAYLAETDAKSFADAVGLVGRQVRRERGARTLHAKVPSIRGRSEVSVGRSRLPVDEFLRQAREDRVLRAGHVGGEIHERARAMSHGAKTHQRRVHPIEGLRAFGQNREDAPRLATYLSALRRGMSRDEAAAWTERHHFDYSNLSQAERGFRDVVPFYTFAARNTRLQAGKLVQRPGKYANLQKVREESAKAAGLPPGWERQLAPYQQRGLPIAHRVGGKVRTEYLTLPATDLNRIPVGLLSRKPWAEVEQQYDLSLQMLNPVLKTALELPGNHSFFFREAIYRDDDHPQAPRWVPAPSIVGKLPKPVRDKLGIVPDLLDKKSGKRVWGWPAGLDYFVRQTPQTGLVAQLDTPVKNRRGQSATDKIVSQLSGVRTVELDMEQAKLTALYASRRQVQTDIEDLRDRGKAKNHAGDILPAYRRLLDKQKQLNDRINTEKLKRGDADAEKPKVKTPAEQAHDALYGSKGGEAAKKAHDLLYGGGASDAAKEAHKALYGG